MSSPLTPATTTVIAQDAAEGVCARLQPGPARGGGLHAFCRGGANGGQAAAISVIFHRPRLQRLKFVCYFRPRLTCPRFEV